MRRRQAIALALSCGADRVSADPDADYQAARADYIQRAAFMFRQNLDPRNSRRVNLEAVVLLRFGADGKFMMVEFQERSGDNAFDTAVEFALRRSIPVLPAPPIPPNAKGPFAIAVRVCSQC
jgi:TonB C terminal